MTRKINHDDARRIAWEAAEEVQKITGWADDDPRIENLVQAIADGPLSNPEISTCEPSSYN